MKTLAKYHSALQLETTPGSGVFTIDTSTNGFSNNWREAGTNTGFFVSENFFDMAGMTMDDKTLMIDAMTTQSCGNTLIAGGAAGDSMVVYDIMTSIPVDLDNAATRAGVINFGLGYPASELNFEHVLYQRRRRYTLDLDTAAAFCLVAEDTQSGSLSPTASDRIYTYRCVQIYDLGGTLTGLTLTAVRHLIQTDVKEEPTYEYLMRLKRSYDLQQTDRD
jgi:hypothetical protein